MPARELTICGLKAVRSRFETHSETIQRLFFTRQIAPQIGDFCRWMAQERLVYRCVESDELERISGTVHHGGIVLVVDAPNYRAPRLDEVREWSRRGETLLILDRISNVHNLGAILRSAVFFGVTRVILPDHPDAAFPSDATYRVAEGALDHIDVLVVDQLVPFLRAIRPFYFTVGATAHGGAIRWEQDIRFPVAIVVGNEEFGLAADVAASCERLVTIPGSGRTESLNVSAASAVLFWEIARIGRSRR